MTEAETIEMEQAIANLVRDFYGKARKDPDLGPIFNNVVEDWDVHLRVITNFWSKALLQTDRYSGHPYVHHVKLPIEPRTFRYLAEALHGNGERDLAARICPKSRRQGQSYG